MMTETINKGEKTMEGIPTTLYEIAPEMRQLMTEEDFDSERFDALAVAFEHKAEAITHFTGELDGFIAMGKEEIKRIQARVKTAENRKQSLKEYLQGCMQEAEIYELKFGTKSVKIAKNPPRVVIDSAEKVPAEFKTVETVTTIDKNALKKALKSKHIDGAHLEQGESLRIR
jgi:GTP-dependent phosphoenolpyruvate carboxykinase